MTNAWTHEFCRSNKLWSRLCSLNIKTVKYNSYNIHSMLCLVSVVNIVHLISISFEFYLRLTYVQSLIWRYKYRYVQYKSTDSLNRTVNGQSLIKLTFDLKFTRICDERCLLGAIYNIHISVCSMSTVRSVLLKKKSMKIKRARSTMLRT